MGWRQDAKKPTVRLQVQVSADLAARIDEVGATLNHSQVSMAALLLDFAVDDNVRFIQIVNSKFGVAVQKMLGLRKKKAGPACGAPAILDESEGT